MKADPPALQLRHNARVIASEHTTYDKLCQWRPTQVGHGPPMAFVSRVHGGPERAVMTGPTATHRDDLGQSLALAMVCSSTSPLLLLDADFTVVAASLSFCEAFHIEPSGAAGQSLFALGGGEWDVPQLRSLLRATVSGDADIDTYALKLHPRTRKSGTCC